LKKSLLIPASGQLLSEGKVSILKSERLAGDQAQTIN